MRNFPSVARCRRMSICSSRSMAGLHDRGTRRPAYDSRPLALIAASCSCPAVRYNTLLYVLLLGRLAVAIHELNEEQIRTWTLEQKDRWWLETVYRGSMP